MYTIAPTGALEYSRALPVPIHALIFDLDGTLADSLGDIADAMNAALADHDHTVIIGQGVTDHKGIFGTTTGLAEKFGKHRLVEVPLAELAEELESRGITVIIKGVQPEHLTLLANMGIVEALRHENHLIDSLDEAIAHARSHVNPALHP